MPRYATINPSGTLTSLSLANLPGSIEVSDVVAATLVPYASRYDGTTWLSVTAPQSAAAQARDAAIAAAAALGSDSAQSATVQAFATAMATYLNLIPVNQEPQVS